MGHSEQSSRPGWGTLLSFPEPVYRMILRIPYGSGRNHKRDRALELRGRAYRQRQECGEESHARAKSTHIARSA